MAHIETLEFKKLTIIQPSCHHNLPTVFPSASSLRVDQIILLQIQQQTYFKE